MENVLFSPSPICVILLISIIWYDMISNIHGVWQVRRTKNIHIWVSPILDINRGSRNLNINCTALVLHGPLSTSIMILVKNVFLDFFPVFFLLILNPMGTLRSHDTACYQHYLLQSTQESITK